MDETQFEIYVRPDNYNLKAIKFSSLDGEITLFALPTINQSCVFRAAGNCVIPQIQLIPQSLGTGIIADIRIVPRVLFQSDGDTVTARPFLSA